LVKKEKITEGRKTGSASKNKLVFPQSLDSRSGSTSGKEHREKKEKRFFHATFRRSQ